MSANAGALNHGKYVRNASRVNQNRSSLRLALSDDSRHFLLRLLVSLLWLFFGVEPACSFAVCRYAFCRRVFLSLSLSLVYVWIILVGAILVTESSHSFHQDRNWVYIPTVQAPMSQLQQCCRNYDAIARERSSIGSQLPRTLNCCTNVETCLFNALPEVEEIRWTLFLRGLEKAMINKFRV